MNKNSSKICGRKTTTLPTPFQIPSISNDRTGPSGRKTAILSPIAARTFLNASPIGLPMLKMA